MKLSDRLEAILNMLGPGHEVTADIGTDHGFTAIEAVRRGLTGRAIACDIARGPIAAARHHVMDAGLSETVDTRVADGLMGLEPGEADAVIISGMGGGLICRILEAGRYKLRADAKLILSPQSELKEFRTWLVENGFTITRERCLMDGGRFYNIMEVISGFETCNYKPWQLSYGRRCLFSEEDLKVRDDWVKHEIDIMIGINNDLAMKSKGHSDRLMEIQYNLNMAICSLASSDGEADENPG